MQKKILSIIGIIIILSVGFGCGYYWLKTKQTAESAESMLLKLGKSPLIDSVVLNIKGAVSKISGRTLTVTLQENSLDILVPEGAKIVSYDFADSTSTVSGAVPNKEIKLEDIKTGNNVIIFAKIGASGLLEGENIAVVSETTHINTNNKLIVSTTTVNRVIVSTTTVNK